MVTIAAQFTKLSQKFQNENAHEALQKSVKARQAAAQQVHDEIQAARQRSDALDAQHQAEQQTIKQHQSTLEELSESLSGAHPASAFCKRNWLHALASEQATEARNPASNHGASVFVLSPCSLCTKTWQSMT